MTSISTTNTNVAPALTRTWSLDHAHSAVQFSAKHMMITTVRGRFHKFDVTLDLDERNLTNSSVEAVIDAASLDTGQEMRDNHLRSADFLDVQNHPTITFKSKRIERISDDEHKVVGDLTIRGVTREITLDTTLEGRGVNPFGKEVLAFSAKTSINRKDWDLNWNVALETGGWLVGDTIKIELDVEVTKEQAAKAA